MKLLANSIITALGFIISLERSNEYWPLIITSIHCLPAKLLFYDCVFSFCFEQYEACLCGVNGRLSTFLF